MPNHVTNGKGDGGKHWRIESNGSEGVVINNKIDGNFCPSYALSAGLAEKQLHCNEWCV